MGGEAGEPPRADPWGRLPVSLRPAALRPTTPRCRMFAREVGIAWSRGIVMPDRAARVAALAEAQVLVQKALSAVRGTLARDPTRMVAHDVRAWLASAVDALERIDQSHPTGGGPDRARRPAQRPGAGGSPRL